MVKRRSFSLSTYMIASVILVHIFLSPVLYTLIVKLYSDSAAESFINHSQNIAGFLSENMSKYHYVKQRESIINQLDSAVLGSNILFIDIEYSDNKRIKTRDDLLVEPGSFKEDFQFQQHDDNIYFTSVPVYLDNSQKLDFNLRIGFDESFVIEQIHTIKTNIVIIMLFYFLAMVSLFAFITRYIHKPLALLRKNSMIIAKGEVEVPMQVPSYITDIHDLSGDLEKMRQTLLNMANRMQIQATHDELTGLPNRYLYSDRMHHAVSISHRNKQNFAVLLLDLDRFKEINDTLGHGIGDKVLKTISSRMLAGMRDSDTIARVGGDEFSIILINVDETNAIKIALKILRLIEPLIEINNHCLQLSASIGIALYPQHGDNPELILQHADVAMYHAKQNNQHYACYKPEMDSDNYENLMLVNDLKSSISDNHFQSLFQPKLDLATGQACGCELLLRWQHPYLGLIYPDRFIPLAEQENIIGELTRWSTSESLNLFIDILKRYPDFQVAINVSPVNLLDSRLLESLLTILDISQFPASNLMIEITENIIMKNPDRSIEILNQFSHADIKISIDDFGTGYSSLAYLQKFPISELKIDKTFITDLTVDSPNYPIVKASITMAHDLGITVVAEGIENGSVHDLLNELGCDRVQGYHYGKPMTFEALESWLSNNK